MSKQRVQTKVETLKMIFTVAFLIGLALCYWMEQPVAAFGLLLVGMFAGSVLRDVRYKKDAEDAVLLDALRESVVIDPNMPQYDVRFKPFKSYGDMARDYAELLDNYNRLKNNGQGRN